MTRVVVSIVSTGELSKVELCLRSIAAQDFGGELRIVVVCNGAPDDSARIRATCPSAVVIVNRARKGFAENHNTAIASTEADFGLVLNPDVELQPSCVRELVAAMRVHERAGIVGPLLRYPNGSAQPSARRFPRLGGTIVRRTPLRKLLGSQLRGSRHFLPEPTEDRPVDWLLGACLLLRVPVWKSIGGFDAGFRPLYVEDIDLGWRIWEAGWEVWQAPSAEATHEHQAATDKRFFDRRTFWHLRGMMRFVNRHPRVLISSHPSNSLETQPRSREAIEQV